MMKMMLIHLMMVMMVLKFLCSRIRKGSGTKSDAARDVKHVCDGDVDDDCRC